MPERAPDRRVLNDPLALELTRFDYLRVKVREAGGPVKIAKQIGVDYQRLRRFLKGETRMMSDKLAEFAKVIGVSTDFILGLTDDPTPHWKKD